MSQKRASFFFLFVAAVTITGAMTLTPGCGSSPPGGEAPGPDSGASSFDGATSHDAATTSDATAPDATTADATTPDAGGLDGATAATDAGDTGSSADASDASVPATGITWPPGGSFPIFPQATQLDVADITNIGSDAGENEDLKILLTTLEGIVNRTQPRIYLTDTGIDAQEGTTFWTSQFDIPLNAVADPMTLLTKYASEVAGIVVYDPNVLDTINLATTIAGVKGGIVASPRLATLLNAAPYNFPTLVDTTTLGLTTNLEVYQYELDNYGTQVGGRMIFGHDPTNVAMADCLIDYAVATQSAVVWLDSQQSAQLDLLAGFYANLQSNAPYLGWWVSEPSGVGASAQYHVPVFAADWSRNLTAFSGIHQTISPPTPPAPPALDTTKAYVAIFMSDGDNLQENQHLIPIKWSDPNRGSVPISWTTQPALVDVAPVILQYYQHSATPNDVLVSGPSGLGYTYPQRWTQSSGDSFAPYAVRSANYLSRAGLRVITVWNNGVLLTSSQPQANDYAIDMPELLGVTDQLGTGGPPTIINDTLPFLVFSTGYASDEASLEQGIQAQLTAWNKSSGPLFVAVQGDMNQSTITPTAFLHVQQYFAAGSATANPDVVFVRGDHLFQLIRQYKNLPMNPGDGGVPSPGDASAPTTDDAGSAAAACEHAGVPGDGTDPSSNSYLQSCGGAASTTTTGANGNTCSIGVVGQHCFLSCAFCNGYGSSAPSSLVLPCDQPINNCCGVLTCGGCPACD